MNKEILVPVNIEMKFAAVGKGRLEVKTKIFSAEGNLIQTIRTANIMAGDTINLDGFSLPIKFDIDIESAEALAEIFTIGDIKELNSDKVRLLKI